MPQKSNSFRRPGFTHIELLCAVMSVLLLLAVVLPVLGAIRDTAMATVSLNNLKIIGAAHASYAADWNGRQLTYTVDELASYGNDNSEAMYGYAVAHNGQGHPSLILGNTPPFWIWTWGRGGLMLVPMNFSDSAQGMGSFRVPNAAQFNQYVGGRFYDEVFFAPDDRVPYELVEPAFSVPWGYVDFDDVYASSYCLSPAAMFNPNVMRSPAAGGWQDPYSMDDGFRSPPLSWALFPDLKTHVVEHHWNQNALPDSCNPLIADGRYDGCEPYYFNHSLQSEPAALFYDGSTRLLPVTEAMIANDMTVNQTGYGLWSIDTPMAGGYDFSSPGGYFNDDRYDSASTGFHILTTNGILGRDTIALPAASKSRRLKHFFNSPR